MKNLYYATFERGFASEIKLLISKQDKNSFIKKLYDDAVLFFGDEKFKSCPASFKSLYIVLDNTKKQGVGAVNAEMKHLLERKDLKIYFPKDIDSFKFVISSEIENLMVDSKLKNAVETMLRKLTRRSISFNATSAELSILAKKDGECLFMKRVFFAPEFTKFESKTELSFDTAFLMCFLSEPAQSETIVEAFARLSKVSFVRSLCFKKSNVIACVADKNNLNESKKRAKYLKEKQFSVMNYDFLSDNFPIRYIDKIITVLPDENYEDYSTGELNKLFFEKIFNLKVKIAVVLTSKNNDISKFVAKKFEIEKKLTTSRFNIYKLKLQ